MLQKNILAIIIIFRSFTLISQNNSLVIFSASGHPFLLNVDGKTVNSIPQSNLKVYELSSGRHTIHITVPSQSLQLKDSVLFVSAPKYDRKEFTYALVHGKKLSLEFKSVSELSGPEVPPVPEAPKETAPVVDNSIYGNLYKAKNNKPVFYQNYNTETGSCQTALTEKDISYAVRLLKTVNDEERQLSYVKSIVENNCYNTAMLMQLLLTFPSEMDRLEIAKQAYVHISDKEQITNLYPAFKYQTIKTNYTSYIEEQENLVRQKKLQCSQPLDDKRFDELHTKIKNSGYENEKLSVLKKNLATICLSTDQAKKLALFFTHDREKLDYMKCAYNVIVDKDNVIVLAEQFQFTETKQEFLKFISK